MPCLYFLQEEVTHETDSTLAHKGHFGRGIFCVANTDIIRAYMLALLHSLRILRDPIKKGRFVS
jgi:hypothetical protein